MLMILCASPELKETTHKTISTLKYGAKEKCIVSGPHAPVKDKINGNDLLLLYYRIQNNKNWSVNYEANNGEQAERVRSFFRKKRKMFHSWGQSSSMWEEKESFKKNMQPSLKYLYLYTFSKHHKIILHGHLIELLLALVTF